MQQSVVKFYYFVVQTLLNKFRALICPSSGARQTAVAASGFRVNVEEDVFSAETTSTSTFIRKHYDGHSNARNIFRSVCTTK
jgi:hypothetical protein